MGHVLDWQGLELSDHIGFADLTAPTSVMSVDVSTWPTIGAQPEN